MTGLAAAIHERQLSPVDVANHYLRRTEELNAQVGAFFTVTAELALEQARAAEKALTGRSGSAPLPPLLGVPIPIKDLNSVADVRQTFGSSVYDDYVPRRRLRGRRDQVGGGGHHRQDSDTGIRPSVLHRDGRWTAGPDAVGSHPVGRRCSGGAAAAVAARLAPAAQGSDGGGSIASPPACAGCSVSSRPAAGCRGPDRARPVRTGHQRADRPDRGGCRSAAGRDERQLPRRHVRTAAAARG